jgi:SAM-dependent methyltransferase
MLARILLVALLAALAAQSAEARGVQQAIVDPSLQLRLMKPKFVWQKWRQSARAATTTDDETKMSDAGKVFRTIYSSIGGYSESLGQGISLDAREADEVTFGRFTLDGQYTYGEIAFTNMEQLFEIIRKQSTPNVLHSRGGIFYDVGCGTGKPSFGAALLHDFDIVGGIEMIAGMLNVTRQATDQWYKVAAEQKMPPASITKTRFDFVHGDATNLQVLDWTVADLIFLHASTWPDEIFKTMATLLPKLRPGALLVSITRKFATSPSFRLISEYKAKLDWGESTVHVYQRV